jgi:hypothetical protein
MLKVYARRTKEQVNFLLAYYQLMGDYELAGLFDELWPKEGGWTLKHIEKKRYYLKLKRTKEEVLAIKRRNARRGIGVNLKKAWDTRGRADQLDVVEWGKVTPAMYVKWGDRWECLSHVVWVLHYGHIPSGMNIVFKDRDFRNCDIDNLEMVSDAEMARRNSWGKYPIELKRAIIALSRLNKTIAKYEEQH